MGCFPISFVEEPISDKMLPEASKMLPNCGLCSTKYGNMQDLALHMKKIHDETDSMRLTRLTNLLLNPQSKTVAIVRKKDNKRDNSMKN